ncbi:MAG: DUF2237 domain-containing protein [Pseudomonadota bacterium]
MSKNRSINVLGGELKSCSNKPVTGFFRDGCCNTSDNDRGCHTVCSVMTDEFLEFSRTQGNDLMTPMPASGFPGLKTGDQWCLCASRWVEAYKADCAPRVVLDATHEKTLQYVALDILRSHSAASSH